MTPISELPESEQQAALQAFHVLADAQRGIPERMATVPEDNPGMFNASGFYQYRAEHIGDLTHRMAQRWCDQMEYGYEYVFPKVSGALRDLRRSRGPARELSDLLRSNWNYRTEQKQIDTTLPEFVAEFEAGAKRYADAHAHLTVFNECQWHAREAAVTFGRFDYGQCDKHLAALMAVLERGAEEWSRWASLVRMAGGKPTPYSG